jgi:uracil-DNA glycosylase
MMKTSECVNCTDLICEDVKFDRYHMPAVELDPEKISIVVISEAAAYNPDDNYDGPSGALFEQTTLLAFQDAGVQAKSLADLTAMGIYFTTAVKCGKQGYSLQTGTIQHCSQVLEQELNLFPNTRAYLLMGDVAIKAVNAIARRQGYKRVIPAGSTYKLRGGDYPFRSGWAFPSYLQAGPAFFIEKTKRKAIAEDIAAALQLVHG